MQDNLLFHIKKEYEELVDSLKNSEEQRQKYLKELDLTKIEEDYFESMRIAAHLKELRKRYVSESLYYFDKVLLYYLIKFIKSAILFTRGLRLKTTSTRSTDMVLSTAPWFFLAG